MARTALLEQAERERVAALGSLNSDTRSELGQYFTPATVANLISSMVFLPESGKIRILDPGAGSGILSAALVQRIVSERPDLHAEIVAIEKDPSVIPHLQRVVRTCENVDRQRFNTMVINADFLLDSVGLGATLELDSFDVVIQNPPYGKLGVSSQARKAMRAFGVDVPNLYAAFLALSVNLLADNGQLVAITPRSFCNGPYFQEFRKYLLNSISLNRIHIFDSRSSVFAEGGVLQENIIFAGVRNGERKTVELSESQDHTSQITSNTVAYSQVVRPGDPHQFVRLVSSDADTETAEQMALQPCTLSDLGIQVSTGRVVDFRSKHALRNTAIPGAHPLVYPGNLRSGEVKWPLEIKKPQWFLPENETDKSLLLPDGWYVAVKRFSAKEEKRRIVAATWTPTEKYPHIAFENHLNVYHINARGLDAELAKGLTAWLNSSLVDKYFRTFSGHTQVNATDLRTLRYPSETTLRLLGRSGVTCADEIDSKSWLVAA